VRPRIVVLAGVNGAGKSSIAGAWLRETGMNYVNPDERARSIREALGCAIEEANSHAWREGVERLGHAIERREDYAFETTLGGKTIPRLLDSAAVSGCDVIVWYVGLSTPEQHVARVRARVAAGGHDIPETKIRERWDSSRRNLIALMPAITELQVFDNSREGDPIPPPRLLLHWKAGRIVAPSFEELRHTPDWAKAIVMRAMKLV